MLLVVGFLQLVETHFEALDALLFLEDVFAARRHEIDGLPSIVDELFVDFQTIGPAIQKVHNVVASLEIILVFYAY